MGQACNTTTTKPTININTHRRTNSIHNEYRMMLDDEEILQSPNFSLISPMPECTQSPSARTDPIYEQYQVDKQIYTDCDGEAQPLTFDMKQLSLSSIESPSISLDFQTQDNRHIDLDMDHDDHDIYHSKIDNYNDDIMRNDDIQNNMIIGKDGKIRTKPNLWRPDTTAPWEEFSDIDELEEEMRAQLVQLTNDNLNIIKSRYLDIDIDMDKCRRSSITSLMRDRSADKWDEEEIESTIDDMQKELIHLMQNELHASSIAHAL